MLEYDEVNKPKHYTTGKIEVIDFIEDSLENPVDFCIGNVIKYVSRFRKKNNPLQDLEKANYYLERAITILKNE